jgi:GH43 family beta-xylosidase
MTHYDDYYLFAFSTNDNITIKRSHNLTTDWDYAETKVVFKPNASDCPYCTDLWAPEIVSVFTIQIYILHRLLTMSFVRSTTSMIDGISSVSVQSGTTSC